ncbi:hypothetical protein FHS61_002723 [Altererythrobacter atlanticus]|uniref:Uncharacterized protein n=1 Tax=Croceibacterium atlanticum TaxID=1267766 RepID=A0A0F7KYK1_9SPHN|nr:DUF192 domain-containing protein [Croceibacterium atlanticum]AKH43870.1 hypothetical protein WYH_02842 [Croceibacterium atlanticum]MBB5733680.1 hypothetical protein [Croceibacterium atlanticum]
MRMPFVAALLPMALILPACSPQAAENSPAPVAEIATHPVSGLEVVPLTVTSGGKTHEFRVEMARSAQAQAQGLMYREEMGPDEGMLFPYAQPRILSFWMKNTPLPLDLIFVGPDGKVINIIANAEPFSEKQLLSDAPASAVLELIGGRAAELGIVPGDEVKW